MAISVDPPEQARRLARNLGLNFPILSDSHGDLIRSLDLLHEGGGPDGRDIPVPAHFLVDRNGKVLWHFRSKMAQDRPDPRDIVDRIANTAFTAGGSPNHSP